MRKFSTRLALGVLACALAVACGQEKRAAQAAIQTAETAVASAGDDVAKYAADQWKGITDSLASAKDSFARGDYKASIAGLQDIGKRIQDAQAAASTKKTELTTAWNNMSAGLPKMVDAIKSRVDILSSSKKLPKGMDAATLDSAKQGLAAATTSWNEAQEAYKNGNMADAVAKANVVKEKAVQVMQSLGMTPPPAATGGGQ
jgi:hypothetical protein